LTEQIFNTLHIKLINCGIGNPARQGCYITAIPHSLRVGGRGLCEGEAELTHEMRAEANET